MTDETNANMSNSNSPHSNSPRSNSTNGPVQTNNVLSWATDLDEKTLAQAHRTADLDFVHKPLALMPDAHLGMGATVGSVVATEGSIIPAAVGVDIGCGMVAQKTIFTRDQVDAHLTAIHADIARAVPSGQPKRGRRNAGSHSPRRDRSKALDRLVRDAPEVKSDKFNPNKIASQFGTLGGGNHFVELTVDDDDRVWVVLHSGSRGPGNLFAQQYIGRARNEMKRVLEQPLDDPDLAHFVQGSPDFEAYIAGMLWAQDYALENRAEMMAAILRGLAHIMAKAGHETGGAGGSAAGPKGQDITDGAQIQCHHNYATCEEHHGVDMWITRKGAIDASEGTWGIIPGSMATGSFIVSGLGNPASYRSASHGAGRRLSRTAARKQLTEESLIEAMDGIAWNDDARSLLDEHPDAYKDIGEVMDNQSDLVKIEHRLETILNYKGT
jgi:tRNA-splicing ligase RtcB